MKKAIFSLILVSAIGIKAQESIQLPDCVTGKQSGVDVKSLKQGLKGKAELPKDFFLEKVAVILVYDQTDNVDNWRLNFKNDKNKAAFNMKKMFPPVKEVIKEAGLNVYKYILVEKDIDETSSYFYNRNYELKDREEFKKNNVQYIAFVEIGRPNKDFDYTKKTSDDFQVMIIGLDESKPELYMTTLKDVYSDKKASPSNYKDAEYEERVSAEATFECLDVSPTYFKDKKIYFVLYPDLLLPKDKGKGMMCQFIQKSYENQKEENKQYNTIFKSILSSSGLDITFVDKKSDVPNEDVYILDYHIISEIKNNSPINDPSQMNNPKYNETVYHKYLYLINNKTKDLYVFEKYQVLKKDQILLKIFK